LQASSKTKFFPSLEGAFQGPNYIMLVGNLDKIPMYSFIHNSDTEEPIIIGNYQSDNNSTTTQQLIIKNISIV